MPNRRKRILLVSALLVVAVGLVVILFPRNEPKYHGRYLSEWIEIYSRQDVNRGDQVEAAKQAVKQIGTNGLPMFVAWISVQTPPWKKSLYAKLPPRIAQNQCVANLLGRKDDERAALGMNGISILGNNAAGAIPKLNSLMQDRTNDSRVILAIHALRGIGAASIPVLRAAFADPNQIHRPRILWSLRQISFSGYTNECMPTIIAALGDQDLFVRSKATNLLQMISYTELMNLPRN